MTLAFRQYVPEDRADYVRVFCSNVPKFFREHERSDFESFIDSSGCPYFVVGRFDEIVGCGGYGIRDGSDVADLCWGMIASNYHGHRLGEYLLLARLNELVAREDMRKVHLATSQHTDGFFQKYGFTVRAREPNGIDEGLDDVRMQLALTEDAKRWIVDRWHDMAGLPAR